MTARLVVWLLRHPMAAVALVLAAIAATGFGAVLAFAPRPAAPRPPAASMGVAAESRLPSPTEFPPPGRVAAMHRALHAMGRHAVKTNRLCLLRLVPDEHAIGRLPDQATRKRMAELVDSWPKETPKKP